MGVSPTVATVAVTMGFLTACAGPLLAPEERKHVCQVAIDSKFGAPAFHAHPLSNPAGGLSGAAAGAVAGLTAVPNIWAWIVTVPAGAAVGAVGGTACALANESRPTANADFERILDSVDAGSLTHGLEAGLNAPRAGCARTEPNASADAGPDTLVEIEQVDITAGCPFGQQEYSVAVKWRVLAAADRRALVETTTRCSQTSFHDVDSWLADPDRSRAEVERVLDHVGRSMAKRVLASGPLPDCRFRSSESGAIEER